MSSRLPYDENHPHYFFRETYRKWVRYEGKWYTPEEWEDYYRKHSINPQVQWYYDIFQVMTEAEKAIIANPTPDRLIRYFAMVQRILKYFNWVAHVHGWVDGKGIP